jgi:hypothetical protein
MKRPILTLRLSRRAIGASVLTDETLTFFDGRHLRSKRDAALKAACTYVERLLELTQPAGIVVDAPRAEGGTTDAILHALQSLFVQRRLNVRLLSVGELLLAFGVPAPQSRTELRRIADPLFSELAAMTGKVRPYVVEAAAAALMTESHLALGGASP